jgi:hypothetical protein
MQMLVFPSANAADIREESNVGILCNRLMLRVSSSTVLRATSWAA